MAEKGLGTGLGALFGDDAFEEAEAADYLMLPITKVEARKDQPRKSFDEYSLAELSESIAEHGIIQPITVRKTETGYYQIIAGERRWRAARQAGLSEVPARIIEADDKQAMEIALIENLQREDLNPVEEAEGYKTLIEEYGLTQEEAAARVGRSRPAVANAMRLLSLPREVRDFLEQGILSPGHARAVLQLKGTDNQLQAAQKIVAGGLSVRQAESMVARMLKENTEKKQSPGDTVAADYIAEVENRLTSNLGRKVKIIEGRKKGRFEIEYYGNEDLERVIDALESLQI